MQATRLNLLSEEKKKHLSRSVYYQAIKRVLELSVIVLVIIGVTTLGAHRILQEHIETVTQQLVSSRSGVTGVKSDISAINNRLTELQSVQAKQHPWTPLLSSITNSIPDTITLNSLRIDRSAKKVTLSGQAPTRDDLLALQQSLEANGCADNCRIHAPVPISLLTQKEDITFTITASMQAN